jgi:hypothetical protein
MGSGLIRHLFAVGWFQASVHSAITAEVSVCEILAGMHGSR